MSGPIVPRDAGEERLRAAGHRLLADRGWAVFLERAGSDGVRRPFPLCPGCREAGADHDRDACPCLLCHGFYAAARTADAWDRLCDAALPAGATHLCVRTGTASGIFVIDLDVRENGPQRWYELARERRLDPPNTLVQRTKSGGFHHFYRLPGGAGEASGVVGGVGSHNRVAPGVDVKGDGGLVVVAPSPGYEWWPAGGPREPAEPSAALAEWVRTARGTAPWRGSLRRTEFGGGAVRLKASEPPPVGARDEYFNALCFGLRKHGTGWDEAEREARRHWEALAGTGAQPDGDVFRWEWVRYKLERVWHTVEPDPDLAAAAATGRRYLAAVRGVTPDAGEVRREGNVTLLGRGRRP